MIAIRLSLALVEVQGSLAGQGRPSLQISAQALRDQLATLGLLVDRKGDTLVPGSPSSENVRVEGKQGRAMFFLAESLGACDRGWGT